MSASGHFVQNLKNKICIDLKWPEMWSKIYQKNPYLSNMARNVIES